MMKNILLLTTGGTIACAQSDDGLTPALDADKLISFLPDIKEICRLTALSVSNTDSSNMTPKMMGAIADAVAANYDVYDGFVITHGTDTLGYTAAALSYMLINPAKPIIITGSQLPIQADKTDAVSNLQDAISFACGDICGVYVAFCHRLIIGTHAVKVHTTDFDAFESVNCAPVVICDAEKSLRRDTSDVAVETAMSGEEVCAATSDTAVETALSGEESGTGTSHTGISGQFHADTKMCPDIMLLKFFPGMRTDIFDYIKKSGCKGVIIESFGLGGLPDDTSDILARIKEATEAGIPVVITTQCMRGGIDLSVYKVGQYIKKRDIIDAGRMTTEAVTMKLMWAIAHFHKYEDIKIFMETSIAHDRD